MIYIQVKAPAAKGSGKAKASGTASSAEIHIQEELVRNLLHKLLDEKPEPRVTLNSKSSV